MPIIDINGVDTNQPIRRMNKVSNLGDDNYEGDIWYDQTIVSGSNPFPGSLLRLRSDQQWVWTTASVEGGIAGKLGLTVEPGTGSGRQVMVLGQAFFYRDNDGGFDSGTTGLPIYASPTVNGGLTHVKPTTSGHIIRIVGYKWNNFCIIFEPAHSYIEVA